MIVLSGALVLVALVLLVFGALDRNLPYVYASIGVSVLSLLLLMVGIWQRRGELDGDDETATPVTETSAELEPALVGAEPAHERTAELVRPSVVPAETPASMPIAAEAPAVRHGSRRVVPQTAPVDDVEDDSVEDDDVEDDDVEEDVDGLHDEEPQAVEAYDDEPADDDLVDEGSGVTVLVVSGRPRYHLQGCRVLRGKESQPLDRDDARMHGFSPCGVCKPDADETAEPSAPEQPDEQGQSFTEALFGEQLFAGAPDDADREQASDLPDRPVQPVLPAVEPAPAVVDDGPEHVEEPVDTPEPVEAAADAPEPVEASEPPAELRGDDPADDPSLDDASPDEPADVDVADVDPADADAAVEPAPDLMGPDELPEDHASQAVALEPTPSTPEPEVSPAEPVEAPALLEADRVPLEADRVSLEAVAAEPVEPPVEPEPVEVEPAGASRRKSPAKRPAKSAPAGRAGKAAPVSDVAAVVDELPAAPAKAKAPAKKAARKTPAKKAPAAAATAAAPAVKRPLVRAVRADALRLGAPSTAGTTTRVAARAAAPATAPQVVVVPDRDRFHRPECRFVRDVAGATTLPKASASRQGYAACGVCKP